MMSSELGLGLEATKGAESGSELYVDNFQKNRVDSSQDLAQPFVRGLLESCEVELTQVSNDLKEFTSKQDEMLSTLTNYNQSLSDNPQLQQLKAVMDGMKGELDRLSILRQEMSAIHERTEKLKGRAERLRGVRASRERREEELVAKLDVEEVGSEM